MVKVTFQYRDSMSNWQWRKQSCTVRSVEECIKIYGLGTDCEYEILEVENLDQDQKSEENKNEYFRGS